MDVFWIKLFVLAVLAALFVLTVWLTPWFFNSNLKAAAKAGAPAEPATSEAVPPHRGESPRG